MPIERSSTIRECGNLLLRRLDPADQACLEKHVDRIDVAGGLAMLAADDVIDAVLFPLSGVISLEATAGAERSIEVGIVGREGMIGWPALMGARRSPHRATVCRGGAAFLRIGVDPLYAACRRSPGLWAGLLQFAHVLMVQTSCAVAAHLEHSLGQRVARWLLMRHDRVGGDILFVLHDEIADSLNVRRASITDQLHLLEGHALIRCTRGRIIVQDRPQLETFAAGAYGAAEEQYRTLIAPFGKTAKAGAGRPMAQVPLEGSSSGTVAHDVRGARAAFGVV